MDEKLQKAIVAARAGERRQAQRLVTDLLKDSPDNSQAWFLLSHLVESRSQQIAFLSKVVELDPAHEPAQERLAVLRGRETVAADGAAGPAAPPPALDPLAETVVDARPEDGDQVRWGEEEPDAAVAGPMPESGLAADQVWPDEPLRQEDVAMDTPAPAPAAPASGRDDETTLTRILILLSILAVIIFAILAYLLYLVVTGS